jgi:precorrin-6Y C5,15-methyltransferase (decarboxylating)
MNNEKIHRGSIANLAKIATPGLSIFLTLPTPKNSPHPPLPLGLRDEHYQREKNLITHPETRAVILSKLRLRPGVMWDLGAGSGSVGIEAAGLRATLAVYAVERSHKRVAHIKANSESEGLTNHHVIEGEALQEMQFLPNPDIVFIGGGGKDLAEIIKATFNRLTPGGRIVVSAVTLETVATLSSVLKEHLREVVSLTLSRSKSVGDLTMMKSENPITIFTFKKISTND